tara:strand:+ start:893 stop:1357 length:465 start_codon:yes stop_codon:yes gene_type:complete
MPNRRTFISLLTAAPLALVPGQVFASTHDVWDLETLKTALDNDLARLVDIRRPDEWQGTAVARGAWPIDMRDPRFGERLLAARTRAEGRPVALICRSGARSGRVMTEIRRAQWTGFVDAAGGMLGNGRERGWIARGYPVVSAEQALAALPPELA